MGQMMRRVGEENMPLGWLRAAGRFTFYYLLVMLMPSRPYGIAHFKIIWRVMGSEKYGLLIYGWLARHEYFKIGMLPAYLKYCRRREWRLYR